MSILPGLKEVELFRARIVEVMGLDFDDSKFVMLAKVLHNRMLACELDPTHYIERLNSRSSEEIRLLARELTVTETYFLRNIEQFNAYAEVAIPERLGPLGNNKMVSVLSAGCASGEEAYSLAITVRERCAYAANNVVISAIDLNPAMLQKAAKAHYSNWSLRDISDELKKRWFRADGAAFVLNESIRKAVTFESRNLTQDAADFWSPERFDIVFCRNVLMYFSNEQAQAAVRRIACTLAPGGYLFLGHAETLRGLSNDFHLRHSHGTFYYQRKQQLSAAAGYLPELNLQAALATTLPQSVSVPWSHSQSPSLSPQWQPTSALNLDSSWIDAIQRASDRIEALTPAAATLSALETTTESTIETAVDFALPEIPLPDPEELLLQAISLSRSGTLTAAEVVCTALLERDELNVGAHYVLALCREGVGDFDGAMEHDQAAAYLDPHFAMPRLHLGLVSRRQANYVNARGHLEHALVLLQQEDVARIVLFGGGFKREALLALCRAELKALGEQQ